MEHIRGDTLAEKQYRIPGEKPSLILLLCTQTNKIRSSLKTVMFSFPHAQGTRRRQMSKTGGRPSTQWHRKAASPL